MFPLSQLFCDKLGYNESSLVGQIVIHLRGLLRKLWIKTNMNLEPESLLHFQIAITQKVEEAVLQFCLTYHCKDNCLNFCGTNTSGDITWQKIWAPKIWILIRLFSNQWKSRFRAHNLANFWPILIYHHIIKNTRPPLFSFRVITNFLAILLFEL